MKKPLLCIIMFAVMTATAVGQTQQGYVKTRGKLSADGKSVVPGVRLSNALVTIENRSPVKSGANGAFSFALPAGTNRYRLQGAELKGYTLADPDAIRQTHTYSKDLPLIVVLEDMKQREADLEAARKSVRNVMKREIRKKQDELDSLRDAHAITQAKYDSLVRDFWEYRQSSEKLINEMAERYVSTDYDQLDDFNRQVQAYIESGQLTKADSMIRSKGSLEERFNRVKQYESTNAQRETEIQQQQEALDKSRQYTQKEKDDLYNDLYRQHLIFLQQPMMQDSALYCLKLRAELDTTRVDAVWEYACLSHKQKHFVEAEKYYLIYMRFRSKGSSTYCADIVGTQNNLGLLYLDLHDYVNSEKYLKLALEKCEKLYATNSSIYHVELAKTQNSLGNLYYSLHDYAKSEMYNKLALDNFEILNSTYSDAYLADLAATQNNLGSLYLDLHDYARSEQYLKLALENKEKLYTTNPDVYIADLAGTQNNLGSLYCDLHDYARSEWYLKLALENKEKLYTANPDAFRFDISITQYNLGNLYYALQDYLSSERYYKLALENRKLLYSANPAAYRSDLASVQNNLGILYRDLNDYTSSERYLKLALENRQQLFFTNPDIYREVLTMTQNNLANLYRDIHDYANSEKYYKLALENMEKLYASNPSTYQASLGNMQNCLGNLYGDIHDYGNSEKYYKLALENIEKLYAANPTTYRADLAVTQYNLGILYRNLQDYENSERFYKLALENRENLFVADPDAYRESVAMTYWNLMLLYADTEQADQYDNCLAKALELYHGLYLSTPSTYKQDIIELQNRTIWRMLMKGNVNEALTLARETFAMDSANKVSVTYYALSLEQKSYQYGSISDYTKAIGTIDEAIALLPEEAQLYDSKGEFLLLQGKEQEALKMWQKVLELNPKFLDEYPEGTTLSNGLKAKGLIK